MIQIRDKKITIHHTIARFTYFRGLNITLHLLDLNKETNKHSKLIFLCYNYHMSYGRKVISSYLMKDQQSVNAPVYLNVNIISNNVFYHFLFTRKSSKRNAYNEDVLGKWKLNLFSRTNLPFHWVVLQSSSPISWSRVARMLLCKQQAHLTVAPSKHKLCSINWRIQSLRE